jgi:hypothetical protein
MHSALPGDPQTVPRAETYACLLLLEHVEAHSHILFITDSEPFYKAFCKGPELASTSINEDLLTDLFQLIDHKSIFLSMQWMPSHLDDPNVKKVRPEWVKEHHIRGNKSADRLAGFGANNAELHKDIYVPHLKQCREIHLIQNRIATIICHLPKRDKQSDKIKTQKPAKLTIEQEAASSQHTIKVLKDKLVCLMCDSSSSLSDKAVNVFCKSECTIQTSSQEGVIKVYGTVVVRGRSTHPTHNLSIYRGLLFCNVCGSYSSERLGNLAKACTKPSIHGQRVREHIAHGRLPPGIIEAPPTYSFTHVERKVMHGVAAQVRDLAREYEANPPFSIISSSEGEDDIGEDDCMSSPSETAIVPAATGFLSESE